MDQKTIAWVSYLTIVGWIIALVSYNGAPAAEKTSLARFHLRQSFGIMATGIALCFAIIFTGFIIPFLFVLYPFVIIAAFIFAILGLIAAINGEEKPVPFLGEFCQKTFTFIS